MKKVKICLILSLIMVSLSFILLNAKKEYLSTDDILGVYVNDELSDKIPSKGDALFRKVVCDDDSTKATWDNDNWGLLISNLNKKVKCNLYFYSGQTIFDFDYTGAVQTFTVPFSGTYKLETWGAQGGYAYTEEATGGYGGYSSGDIFLKARNIIYLSIGGKGDNGIYWNKSYLYNGGYNGGGNAMSDGATTWGGGGGATSIQNTIIDDGQLKNYEDNKDSILIVSGGGGGAGWHYHMYLSSKNSPYLPHQGGSGGGYKGSNGVTESKSLATGGTQDTAGLNGSSNFEPLSAGFGYGGNYGQEIPSSGGGSGFYGGGTSYYNGSSGGGGSGYIGNPLLTNKAMYCYNCEESNEENTKTISTTCVEETPTTDCAKKGNGYARITLISIDE